MVYLRKGYSRLSRVFCNISSGSPVQNFVEGDFQSGISISRLKIGWPVKEVFWTVWPPSWVEGLVGAVRWAGAVAAPRETFFLSEMSNLRFSFNGMIFHRSNLAIHTFHNKGFRLNGLPIHYGLLYDLHISCTISVYITRNGIDLMKILWNLTKCTYICVYWFIECIHC